MILLSIPNGWPSVSQEQFEEVGQMLAANKVLRLLQLSDLRGLTNQSLAMHPMIQQGTTSDLSQYRIWYFAFATLEQLRI